MGYFQRQTQIGDEGILIVKPMVEDVLGEELKVSSYFWDTIDLESENYLVEVKSRTYNYHWKDDFIEKEGWLIPECKVKRARTEKKKVIFYYYWRSDGSLWELEYDQDVFDSLTPRVPPWHKDQQSHYFVPRRFWTLIEFQ